MTLTWHVDVKGSELFLEAINVDILTFLAFNIDILRANTTLSKWPDILTDMTCDFNSDPESNKFICFR